MRNTGAESTLHYIYTKMAWHRLLSSSSRPCMLPAYALNTSSYIYSCLSRFCCCFWRESPAVCVTVSAVTRRLSSYQERLVEEETHAASVKNTWKRISLFVCLPVVGYFAWKSLIGEEHHSYSYIPWSHLRIRTKPFPWGDGDTSLFHNHHTNPGPDEGPKTVRYYNYSWKKL
jgi:cytochrome c oxidase subunit 6a